MLKKTAALRFFLLAISFSTASLSLAAEEPAAALRIGQSEQSMAPYLREDAPAFNLTIQQFREKFNADNPQMALEEYKIIMPRKRNLRCCALLAALMKRFILLPHWKKASVG